jgi:hypothetical protein
MAPPAAIPHRPGMISLFFVAKAAVFAAAFWIWLLILVVTGKEVSGAHVLAGAGAMTTTLVGVVLGTRVALQRNAAERHAEVKRLLVDISWNVFTAAGNGESRANVVPFPTVGHDAPTPRTSADNGDRERRR